MAKQKFSHTTHKIVVNPLHIFLSIKAPPPGGAFLMMSIAKSVFKSNATPGIKPKFAPQPFNLIPLLPLPPHAAHLPKAFASHPKLLSNL